MTLLRIDKRRRHRSVSTATSVSTPDAAESHVITQHRVVLDHLDAIREKLLEIEAGTAERIPTDGPPLRNVGPAVAERVLRMRRRA